jgi:hypothetical protein
MKMNDLKLCGPQWYIIFLGFIFVACGGKTKNLRNPSNPPAGANGESDFASADRSQARVWTRGSQPLSPDEVAHKAEMQSHHGFGFNLTASQIPAALDATKLPPDLATPEQIAALASNPAISTIYSGPSLNLDQCMNIGFGGSATQSQLARDAFPTGAKHLAEILPQDYLLDIFAPGQNWFQSALMSLEEWEPTAQIRPKDPTHAFLRARLKKANNPGSEFWKLGAISFRVGDRSALLEQSDSEAVLGQIKISYHLDSRTAESDPSIISAVFIHSIGIQASYYDEFIFDLLAIRQQPEFSGCDVFRIIDKYVRNNGASKTQTPRSFYFFAHTNIFDEFDPVPVHEWRFAELKPVWMDAPVDVRPVDDPLLVSIPTTRLSQFQSGLESLALAGMESTTTTFASPPTTTIASTNNQIMPAIPIPSTSSSPSTASLLYGRATIPPRRIEIARAVYLKGCLVGKWIANWETHPTKASLLTTVERDAIGSCPLKASNEEIEKCWADAASPRCTSNANTQPMPIGSVAFQHENTPWPTSERLEGQIHPKIGRHLRIVPMSFVPAEVMNDSSDQVKPRPDLAFKLFFSGTVSDCAQLPSSDPISVGEADLTNAKARKEINCRLLINADGSRARPDHPAFAREESYTCAGCHNRREGLDVDPVSFKLNPLASMNKSHISFADGGNRPCSPFFSHPRTQNQVSLSPYFLEFANGHAMNGYSEIETNPIPPASAGVFDAGSNIQRSFMSTPSADAFRCFSRAINPGEQNPTGGQ